MDELILDDKLNIIVGIIVYLEKLFIIYLFFYYFINCIIILCIKNI